MGAGPRRDCPRRGTLVRRGRFRAAGYHLAVHRAAPTTPPQSRLLADANADDGDRAFASGAASNRTDVFSELDADYGSLGVRFSGAFWYDPVYFNRTANNSPATFNPFTVPNDKFTGPVRTLEGLNAELLDGFVHDTFDIGGTQVGVRVGRYTLIWGESLFFGQNGIAAGQAPIDFIKADTVPETPARELFLPVNQISGSIQIRPGLSIELYDQLEWRHDRFPGVGSSVRRRSIRRWHRITTRKRRVSGYSRRPGWEIRHSAGLSRYPKRSVKLGPE
jgi:Protein of unknown function (DUF1302)